MNSMKSFYTSIALAQQPHGSYLEALSELTRMNLKQVSSLQSDLAWQNWGEQRQDTEMSGP
jgi:hypothetical protein